MILYELMKNTFLKIYFFFLVFYLAVSLGRGFLPVWFLQNGLSYQLIVLYFLLKLALPSLIILLPQKFSTRKSLSWALVSEILLMLSVYHFFYPWQIYLVAFFSGTTVVYFYLVYNSLFFENSPKDKKAFSASLYLFAGALLGIVVPLIAGLISQKFGFTGLFSASIAILLICFLMIKSLPQISFDSNLYLLLRKHRPVVVPLLVEGIRDAISLAVIPTFTLLYIKKPLPYGVYLSYIACVSAVASLFLGFLSDKYKKRTIFLYSSAIITSFIIILFGLVSDLNTWSIVTGLYTFIATINASFVITLVLDKIPDIKESMILREFLLGAGRTIGSLIYLAPLVLGFSPTKAFVVIGLIYLCLPLIVYRQKLYQQ